ncbi:protein tyrosine phosphatase [Candidatus Woesearchaeota archaeon]|nr:protein tyrosine phosphatase [Candidatus Woesearchaeota archaeon]
MNILFICNQNKNRSKTAELLFKDNFATKSAGLYAQKKVSAKELTWADVVVVMEEEQRHEVAKRFPKLYLQKRILNWNVPDSYLFNHPRLVELLKEKMEESMELFS